MVVDHGDLSRCQDFFDFVQAPGPEIVAIHSHVEGLAERFEVTVAVAEQMPSAMVGTGPDPVGVVAQPDLPAGDFQEQDRFDRFPSSAYVFFPGGIMIAEDQDVPPMESV